MRVARLHGIGDLRLCDEPVPPALPGRSLVRVTAVGLCGSDLHWYGAGGIGDARLEEPLVIGHEFAGVVEDGPLAGQRVAVDPAIPCGRCDVCLRGDRNLCPTVAFAGHGRTDGALRELVSWPTELLHQLPPSLSDCDGAMLEPLGVALHAWDLGHVQVGSAVAIVGCGPIGLCLVQVARAGGATTVIGVDPLEHRRDAAKGLGADVVLGPEREGFRDLIDAATGGRGVDVAFEVAGSDGAVGLAIEAASPGARVVLAGIPGADSTTFQASAARRGGLTLVLVRRMKEMYPRTIGLVERGLVDVNMLVTSRFPLDHVDEAFQTAHARDGLKVVVEPHR
jgi:L-iditol 2-dehydrogenase